VTLTEPDLAGSPEPASGETDTRARAGSLKPVLDIIPAEAYDNPTGRGLFYFGRDMVIYLIAIAGLIAFANPLVVIPLELLAALAIAGLFIVAHDAAHGALFKAKTLNSVIGHIAMLPSWHVYEGWVLGHNRIHHGYTVRQGFDFVWHPYTAEELAAMSPIKKLRHRIEWSWAGAGIYYIREVWWNKMVVGKPPARWVSKIRRDRFIVLAFVVAATLALTAVGWVQTGSLLGVLWLVARVLVIPFLAFSFIIGSFVHVHHVQPEIVWWKRREWTKFKGQMEGTTILRAPWGSNFFFHWIMVHIPHHVDMRIPMYNLELAADAIKAAYPDTVHDEPLRFRDYIHNTRVCKLYDFDAHEWLTYDQGTARLADAARSTDAG
jgi:omega-6 fatty acid desaturase (delta-12 desaturase)